MTDLAALRDLAGKATPSHWDAWAEASWEAEPEDMWSLAPFVTRADRDLIIAFDPTTAAALLDEIESLRKVRDAAVAVSEAHIKIEDAGLAVQTPLFLLLGNLDAVLGKPLPRHLAATEPTEREAAPAVTDRQVPTGGTE